MFISLSDVLVCLGPDSSRALFYNILIGNQIIVQANSDEKLLILSLINVLKQLLPTSMSTVIEFSEKYRESYECNFLGVSESVKIPSHVDKSTYAVVNIVALKTTSLFSPRLPLNQFVSLSFAGENLFSPMAEEILTILRLPVDEDFKKFRLKSTKQAFKT